MLIYFVPLLLLGFALAGQTVRNKYVDSYILVCVATVAILVSGFRMNSDGDYYAYAEMYRDNPNLHYYSQDRVQTLYGEGGYLYLTALFKSMNAEFALLVLVCATTAISLKSLSAYHLSRHASFCFCLYLCINFITIEFIQMRWAVSTGLIALGFCSVYRRKNTWAALCFLIASALSYFSILYGAVALILHRKGYRRFFWLLTVSFLARLFIQPEVLADAFPTVNGIYVLERLARYITDPDNSHVGILSYTKIVMYPIIYLLCVAANRGYEWKQDELNVFLLKLSMITLSISAITSVVPMLTFRASVISDFFSIIWIVNAMGIALKRRALAYAAMALLFATWYIVDLSNNLRAEYLYFYRSWLL